MERLRDRSRPLRDEPDLASVSLRAISARRESSGLRPLLERLELELEGRERLAHLVVEHAGASALLLLAGIDQADRQLVKLLLALLERIEELDALDRDSELPRRGIEESAERRDLRSSLRPGRKSPDNPCWSPF